MFANSWSLNFNYPVQTHLFLAFPPPQNYARFICIVVCISSLFLLLCSIPLHEYYNLFIHSPVDGHWVCFQCFDIVRKPPKTLLFVSFVGMHLFLLWMYICLEMVFWVIGEAYVQQFKILPKSVWKQWYHFTLPSTVLRILVIHNPIVAQS